MKEVVILYNPTACSGITSKKLLFVKYYLNKLNIKFRVYENVERDKIINKYNKIIVVGGDGTLHDVVNSILKSGNNNAKVLFIPAGTGNNAAENFNMPYNIKKACEVIKNGKTKKIDLGKLQEIFFITGLSIGFPPLVLDERNKHKFRLWKISYLIASLRILFSNYKPNNLKIEINNKVINTKAFTIAVGKKKYMGLNLFKDSKIDDGLLYIFLMEDKPKIILFLKSFYWFLLYKHLKFDKSHKLRFFKTNELKISSEKPFLVEMDGEILGERKELHVKIANKAINFVLPKNEN